MMKKEDEEKQKGRKSMKGSEQGSTILPNKKSKYTEN